MLYKKKDVQNSINTFDNCTFLNWPITVCEYAIFDWPIADLQKVKKKIDLGNVSIKIREIKKKI